MCGQIDLMIKEKEAQKVKVAQKGAQMVALAKEMAEDEQDMAEIIKWGKN